MKELDEYEEWLKANRPRTPSELARARYYMHRILKEAQLRMSKEEYPAVIPRAKEIIQKYMARTPRRLR